MDPTQLSDEELFAIAGIQPQQEQQSPPQRGVQPPAPSAGLLTGNAQELVTQALPGVNITSGRRTPERQQQLIQEWERGGRRGVRPADNSYHLQGRGLDLTPAPGQTMAQLEQQVRASGLPFRTILNEGDHIHVDWEGDPLPDEQSMASPQADFSSLSDEELMALVQQSEPMTSMAPIESEGDILDLTGMDQASQNNLLMNVQQGQRVRLPNGEVVTARGPALVGEGQRQVGEGLYVQEPSLAETAGAFSTAASEQIPFLDESIAGTVGLLSGRGYEATRDVQRQAAEYDRMANPEARQAGGIAGFGVGMLAPGGSFVARGPTAAYRASRAGAVGGGYGALYGAGQTEGGLEERAQGAATGAATGVLAGAATQGLFDRGARAVADRMAQRSSTQALADEGIRLTPGQMSGRGVRRTIEEVGTSVPILRESILSAQRRGVEDFNRAVGNRVLAPLGETVPQNIAAGRELVRYTTDRVSDQYNRALADLIVAPDQAFTQGVQEVVSTARLTPQAQEELGSILANTLAARFNEPIDGIAFKAIDEELGAAARAARNNPSAGPSGRYLADAIGGIQDQMDDLLVRIDPERAQMKMSADEAFANLVRLQGASAAPEAANRGGVFTPAQLNAAVRRAEGGRRNARYSMGDALMQDLSDNAIQVLPNRVPDSGTPLRSLMSGNIIGGVVGGTAGLAASPLYSEPVQNAINAVYRASQTNNGQAIASALDDLRRLAARNPALIPIYEDVARTLLPGAPNQISTTPRPEAEELGAMLQRTGTQ